MLTLVTALLPAAGGARDVAGRRYAAAASHRVCGGAEQLLACPRLFLLAALRWIYFCSTVPIRLLGSLFVWPTTLRLSIWM